MNNKNQIIKHEASTHFKNDEYDNGPSLSYTKKFKFKTEPISEDNKNVIVISDEEKTPVKRRFEPIQLNQTELFKKHMSSYIKQGFSITKARKFAKLSCILKNTNADTNGQPIIPQDFDFEKVNMKEVGCHKLSGAARKRRAILLRKGFSMKEATVLCYNKMRWCKDQRKKRDASVEYIEEMREKHPNRSKYKLMNLKYKPRHLRVESENRDNNDADRDSPVTFTKTSDDTSNITTKRIGLLPSEYPSKSWTTIQFEILQQCILNAIRKVSIDSGKPNFAGCIFKYGFITLIYNIEDSCTENWIKSVVPTLKPWPNFSVRIVEEDLPCPQIFIARFPDKTGSDNESILKKIESQNKGLGSKKWEVLYRNEDGINIELTLGIDPISVNSLDKFNYQIKYGSNNVYFTRKDIKTNDDSKPKNKSISSTEHSNDGWLKRTESIWNDNRKTAEYTNMTANFETNQDDDSSSYLNTQKPQHRSESEWSIGGNRFANDYANFNLNSSKMQKWQQNQQHYIKQNHSVKERTRHERILINDMDSSDFRYSKIQQRRSENEWTKCRQTFFNDDESSKFRHSMLQQQEELSENTWPIYNRSSLNDNENIYSKFLMTEEQHSENELREFKRNLVNDNEMNNFINPMIRRQQQCSQNEWSRRDIQPNNNNESSDRRYSMTQQRHAKNELYMDVGGTNNDYRNTNSSFSMLPQQRYQQEQRSEAMSHNDRLNSRFSMMQQRHYQEELQEQQYQQECFENQWPNNMRRSVNKNDIPNPKYCIEQQQYKQLENISFMDMKTGMNYGNHNTNFSLAQQRQVHQLYCPQQNYENKWSRRETRSRRENASPQCRRQQVSLHNQWYNNDRSRVNDNERINQSYHMAQQRDDVQQRWENESSIRFNGSINNKENFDLRHFTMQQEQDQQRLENERLMGLERHRNGNRYRERLERRQAPDIFDYSLAQANFRNDWSPNLKIGSNHWRSEPNNNGNNYMSNNNVENRPNGPSRWSQ